MASNELIIEPRGGWQPVNVREMWTYRELFFFLIWRDIKIRYRQTVLGGLWAVLQPLVAMVVFTLVFNRMAGMQSNGAPYALFSFAGLIPWTFFGNAVSTSGNSLIGNQHLVSKIYFPRLFIPLAAIGALFLDMALSLALMGVLMAVYHWPPSATLVFLPVLVLAAFLVASGLGLILSAMNVQYRDVKYAIPFLIQMGLFVTPVIYPVSYLPARMRPWIALNPMAGVAEGFRYALLGTPADWQMMFTSLVICVAIFVAGVFMFRRMETHFADVI